MMDQVEVSDFVVKSDLKFERGPPGPLVCSRTLTYHLNQSETETVRNALLCNRSSRTTPNLIIIYQTVTSQESQIM